MIEIGDTVEVIFEDQLLRRKIYKIGNHPPFFDHIMIEGVLWWFHISKCKFLEKDI